MRHPLNRRELLRNAALTGMGVYVAGQATTAVSASPNEKLNIACVGLGNQGRANLELVKSQNIVALCDVDYAGPLTETVLLGNIAYRVGGRIEWDSEHVKATNTEQAERYLRREYRQGWTLG